MSRYLLLVLLNIPLIVAGMVNSVVAFKLKTINRRHLVSRLFFWSFILVALILAQPIYNFLFAKNLTQTEPLSLFDVIQITGIIYILLLASRAYTKADSLQRQIQELHQQLSIRLADESKPAGKSAATKKPKKK